MKVLREKTKVLADFLSPPLMERVFQAGVTRRYADGQMVQQRGDVHKAISFVRSGSVIAGNYGLDGSFLASAILYPGEYFGDFTVLAGLPRTQNLWAQGATEITEIPGKRFLELIDQEPAIARAMLTISTLRTHELVEFLDIQRRLPLGTRIARLLLSAAGPDAASETVECRHEDLAFVLGVSRVSIGKALKKLQGEGYLELGYGHIYLPDVKRFRNKVAAEFQILPLDQSSSRSA